MRFTLKLLESYDHDFFYERLKKYLISIGEPDLDEKHHISELSQKLKMKHDDLIFFLLAESVDHKIGMHVILNKEDKSVYFVKCR